MKRLFTTRHGLTLLTMIFFSNVLLVAAALLVWQRASLAAILLGGLGLLSFAIGFAILLACLWASR